MGDTTVSERIQADHEVRIRNLESTLSALASTLQQMVVNTDDIKERLAHLTQGTATQEHINRVEVMVTSAHKRLDEFNKEFWKIRAEHDSCLLIKRDTADAIVEFKESLNDLKLDFNSMNSAVAGLKKDKDALTSFFSTRLGVLVDRAIQFAPWIIFWLYVERQASASKAVIGG